jgi:ketosteroid isomerase-like protein
MGKREDELRKKACDVMHALADARWEEADAAFHPHAVWWIIGQGELAHSRVRELAEKTEGRLAVRGVNIVGTVAEGNKVAVESRGNMSFPDGRRYDNTYHHVVEFEGDLIINLREYFDTHYVRQVFGEMVYEKAEPATT